MRIPVLSNHPSSGMYDCPDTIELDPSVDMESYPTIDDEDPETRVRAALEVVRRRLDADEVVLHRLDHDELHRARWTRGTPNNSVADRWAGRAAEARYPITIDGGRELGQHYAGVPLRIGGRLLGVLGVVRDDELARTQFGEDELQQLHVASIWIACELDRDRVLRERNELIVRLHGAIHRMRSIARKLGVARC